MTRRRQRSGAELRKLYSGAIVLLVTDAAQVTGIKATRRMDEFAAKITRSAEGTVSVKSRK